MSLNAAAQLGCAAQPLSSSWQERPSTLTTVRAQGDNYLTSTIPASWLRAGPLQGLLYLSLAQNQLVGTIPTPEPYCSLCVYKVGAPLAQNRLTMRLVRTHCLLTCSACHLACRALSSPELTPFNTLLCKPHV